MTTMVRCKEDLRKKQLGDESFKKILAEVSAVASDREEQLRLLTERVLFDLSQRKFKKVQESSVSKERRENLVEKVKKRKACTEAYCNDEEVGVSDSDSGRNYRLKTRKRGFRSSRDEDEYRKCCDEDEGCRLIKEKKKAKKVKRSASSIPFPPPDMPVEFKNKIQSMHGYQVKLIIQKPIYRTDLNEHHDRLSMPFNQLKDQQFLGEQFEKQLKDVGSIRVTLIDPNLNEHELGLAKWVSKSSFSYVINRGWKSIIEDEEINLQEDDFVQVWSFRVNNSNLPNQERLCFALVKLQDHEKKDTNGSPESTVSQEAIESSIMTKNDQGKSNANGVSDSLEAIEPSLVTMTKNDQRKDNVDGISESKEVIESLMVKKDQGERDIHGKTASSEAIQSSMTKNQLECGAKKHVSLKFRNVTFAKIETSVSVCVHP